MSFCDYINSTTKTAVTSLGSVFVGSIIPNDTELINTLLQRGAWTIAIIAGIVASVNGIDNYIIRHKNKKR
ncbi:MAG: hypothetical protein ACOYO1_02520 [Bacteroidales bacterium]